MCCRNHLKCDFIAWIFSCSECSFNLWLKTCLRKKRKRLSDLSLLLRNRIKTRRLRYFCVGLHASRGSYPILLCFNNRKWHEVMSISSIINDTGRKISLLFKYLVQCILRNKWQINIRIGSDSGSSCASIQDVYFHLYRNNGDDKQCF